MTALSIPQNQFFRMLAATAYFTSQVARPLVAVVLTVLEPFVRVILSLAMTLGIVAAVVFEISAAGPGFSFLGMVAASLGFGLMLAAYYALLGLCLD